MAIYVYNLLTSDKDAEYEFSDGVSAEWAVCFAYASDHNLMSLLFATRQRGQALEDVFPLVRGRYSVSCGDYAASLKD
jgi:hypothetical protein